MERCGADVENNFQPQRANFLDCLGPAAEVCNCTWSAEGEHSCEFDESRCGLKCSQGLREWEGFHAAALNWQHMRQETLTARCTDGGDLYLLTHYSEDCRSSWKPWLHCTNEPCEDECVSMLHADCPPPLASGFDAFFRFMFLRILVPAFVLFVLCQVMPFWKGRCRINAAKLRR